MFFVERRGGRRGCPRGRVRVQRNRLTAVHIHQMTRPRCHAGGSRATAALATPGSAVLPRLNSQIIGSSRNTTGSSAKVQEPGKAARARSGMLSSSCSTPWLHGKFKRESSCKTCGVDFFPLSFTSRHHCRSCLHSFCDAHSSRALVLSTSRAVAVRVCDGCYRADGAAAAAALAAAGGAGPGSAAAAAAAASPARRTTGTYAAAATLASPSRSMAQLGTHEQTCDELAALVGALLRDPSAPPEALPESSSECDDGGGGGGGVGAAVAAAGAAAAVTLGGAGLSSLSSLSARTRGAMQQLGALQTAVDGVPTHGAEAVRALRREVARRVQKSVEKAEGLLRRCDAAAGGAANSR